MTDKELYRAYVKEKHRLPKKNNDIDQSIGKYTSIQQIETEIWTEYATMTLTQCVEDPSFGEYIAREKMLAYVFVLFQNMNADEEQIRLQMRSTIKWWTSPLLKEFKAEFNSFVKTLIDEGQERGEIQKRLYINNSYPVLFWNTLLFIFIFWSKDTSKHKEQTDVAVEKWINLLFDTLAPNAVDSAVDLAQFMIKRKFYGITK